MKNKPLLLAVAIMVITINALAQGTGSFTDSRNGITYKTVKIGEQVWMAENLAFRPDNGSTLIYENNQANKNTYGCLYDWQTAMKASPAGWHIPTQAEYETLINYLGGLAIAGGKLKEAGFEHWKSPNTAANNSSGFTLIPGGGAHEADDEASFYAMGESCLLWCSQVKGNEAIYLLVNYERAYVNFHSTSKSAYFSVRCVKD